MLQRKPLIQPPSKLGPIIAESDELIAIFTASIKTSKENINKQ